MNTKRMYLFDKETGAHCGFYDAQESPAEPGEFITPICSTEQAPPAPVEGSEVVFIAGAWQVRELPVPEPVPVPPAIAPL